MHQSVSSPRPSQQVNHKKTKEPRCNVQMARHKLVGVDGLAVQGTLAWSQLHRSCQGWGIVELRGQIAKSCQLYPKGQQLQRINRENLQAL